MDPLSDVIALLRPHAAVSKPITARGEWGVRYSAYGLPGFAIVLDGQCWLAIDGAEPVRLERGDFVLLPSTPAFRLSSHPGAACIQREPSNTAVRHGDPDGEPDLQMLGGAFKIEAVNAPLLLGLLPGMIHIRAADGHTGRLTSMIGLLIEECTADRPGRDMVIERLLEGCRILPWRRPCAQCTPTSAPDGPWPGWQNSPACRAPPLRRALPRRWAALRSNIFCAGGWRLPRMN
jgi:hypothetical protein